MFGVTPNQAADRTDVDYAIVGLTDAGTLDAAFGTDGVVIADVDASGDSARNIGTDADGKILATGYSRDGDGVVSPVLIRMSAAGRARRDVRHRRRRQQHRPPRRHRVVPGRRRRATTTSSPATAAAKTPRRRSTSSSTASSPTAAWDETFGTDGVTRLDLAGEDDRARNVTVLPDGNILAVGSGKLDADNVDAMVVMLDPDGAPVETFGDGGHVLVDLGGPADAFFGVTVTADESAVLIAGFKGADPDGDRERRRRARPHRPLT